MISYHSVFILQFIFAVELDTFANHVYDSNTAKPNGKPTTTAKPPTASDNDTPDGKSYVIGNERCYIYEQAGKFVGRKM